MSDFWYREPFELPPWEDGLGQAWNFDGTPANEAAEHQLRPSPNLTSTHPNSSKPCSEAEVMLTIAETYSDKMRALFLWRTARHNRSRRPGQRRRAPMKQLDERISPEEVIRRFGVTEELVRKWASRYGLKTDYEGRFRFGDIVEIEHKTRTGKGARGKLTLPELGVTIRLSTTLPKMRPA